LKLLDVNVVLAAHRDDHPHYEFARAWIERVFERADPFSVIDLVAGAFLRIATNRRIFTIPTPLPEALHYLSALRSQPAHVLLSPGSRHLQLLRRLSVAADASGDLIPDAQLAAVAIEHAAELVSFDRDFARFDDLHWVHPAAGRAR
jgi:toxin-antitoxin system PIN domain toxin